MLNPSVPRSIAQRVTTPYVAPPEIADLTIADNLATFADGAAELRLQPVYGEEFGLKLERANLIEKINNSDVLEVCAGTGFLTYHLLSRLRPLSLTVNDLSLQELSSARALISAHFPEREVSWMVGDMHLLDFPQTFDVIIGNSFLHHFHNVPHVLRRISDLLRPGGVFVSLHEPTAMAIVVESSSRLKTYPAALLAPGAVVDFFRHRQEKSPQSLTDVWLFEPKSLESVALQSGFSHLAVQPWHLARAIIGAQSNFQLTESKPSLTQVEQARLQRAIRIDAWLNRFLPARFFGAVSLVFGKN